jgi:hypothetical protein
LTSRRGSSIKGISTVLPENLYSYIGRQSRQLLCDLRKYSWSLCRSSREAKGRAPSLVAARFTASGSVRFGAAGATATVGTNADPLPVA